MDYRKLAMLSVTALALGAMPLRAEDHGKHKQDGKGEKKAGMMMKGDGGMSCGMGEGGKDMGEGPACPMMLKGAKLELENLPNGISVKVTSDDPELVKRIQDKAQRMKERHELMAEKHAAAAAGDKKEEKKAELKDEKAAAPEKAKDRK